MIKSNIAFMHAQEILKELNINIDNPIDLDYILTSYGITCRYIALKTGVDGAFKRSGLDKQIILNGRIQNRARRRFTVAHELGHIVMNHPPTICSSDIYRWINSLPDYEEEANQFAKELLLPQKAIKKRLKEKDITIKTIVETANHYSVSLRATTRRFLELSKDAMVMLIHDEKAVEWKYFSKGRFLEIDESGIRNNTIIDSINSEKPRIRRKIDVEQWVADDMDGYICVQDTIYFKNRKEYMTLLSFEEEY